MSHLDAKESRLGGRQGRSAGGRPRRASRRSAGLWLVSPFAMLVQLVGLGALVFLAAAHLLEGRSIPVPAAVAERLEQRAEAALQTDLEFGRVAVVAEGAGRLRLVAEDVRLSAPDGERRAAFPRVEADLGLRALLPPFSAPRTLRISGADLRITRRADGTLDLGSDVLSALFSRTPPRTPVEAAERIRQALGRPALSTLEGLALDDLSVTFHDRRSGRVRAIPGARLDLEREPDTISLSVALETPGRMALRASFPARGALDLQVSALMDGVPAADLAAQVPALVWLAPLQAEVSGALIGAYGAQGSLGRLDGTLEIGGGRIAPEGGGTLPFDRAQAYFTYRPEDGRLAFSQIAFEAPLGRVSAEGHAYLHGEAGALPRAMTAQIAVRDGVIDAGDALETPIALRGGAIDAKIDFAPFSVEIGHAMLATDARAGAAPQAGRAGGPAEAVAMPARADAGTPDLVRLSGRGRIVTGEGGFRSSLDLALSEIAPARVLSLWPLGAVPRTRQWLADNLLAGRLSQTRVGVRLRPDARPDISLSFRFREARVRAVRGLPPIVAAQGRASLGQDRFTLALEGGRIVPPEGGALDLSGSAFTIADTTQRPGSGEVRWHSESSVTAALSLLDQPPLGLMARTGRPVALAEGRARLAGELRFPIRKGVTPDLIGYDFAGVLSDVRSDVLVPGRAVAADELVLGADRTGLEIAGRATLDDVPLRIRYAQGFGPDGARPRVTGTAELSAAAARAFGVALPPGAITGRGVADVDLTFPRDAPADLRLTSDLRGIGLRVPELGWSKPASGTGALELAVRLGRQGAPPRVDRLALSAPGLDAEGAVTLAPGGGLERLTLSRARVGGWLDAAVTLRGRGARRAPDIVVRGGRADLRDAPFGRDGVAGGGGRGGGSVSGRLDRVTLTDGVALTDVRLDLQRGGGLSGTVRGRVNGGAVLSGVLTPGPGGRPGLRLRAEDAGGVLAAAGAFEEARGGALDLTLTPAGRAGRWDGALTVEGIRVTAAPGLAALLNAISVVGLLDQLNGPGLAFSTIRAAFRLTPAGVEITSASAVGPSLGISAEGIYDLAANRVDLRGVLSPIYAVNSIGQVFTREGEGLFGMTYSLSGPASAPAIRVNPLSMLTPGAFRDIFRTAPPNLPEGAAQ